MVENLIQQNQTFLVTVIILKNSSSETFTDGVTFYPTGVLDDLILLDEFFEFPVHKLWTNWFFTETIKKDELFRVKPIDFTRNP